MIFLPSCKFSCVTSFFYFERM
ncbi:CLUMA_CG013908, isoform A [Clunio marinus]|uniref:CLUMA_CG013908, isoform A n=1 Tax=Clunio marinus TaxID=568069 RepID=A0A1J1IKE3_9DIPT|nr:CLUMA_CG013908, isoform A [Clunio marinus]